MSDFRRQRERAIARQHQERVAEQVRGRPAGARPGRTPSTRWCGGRPPRPGGAARSAAGRAGPAARCARTGTATARRWRAARAFASSAAAAAAAAVDGAAARGGANPVMATAPHGHIPLSAYTLRLGCAATRLALAVVGDGSRGGLGRGGPAPAQRAADATRPPPAAPAAAARRRRTGSPRAGSRPRARGRRPVTPTVSDLRPSSSPSCGRPSLLHKYQLGIAMLPGLGFRVIAPYEDERSTAASRRTASAPACSRFSSTCSRRSASPSTGTSSSTCVSGSTPTSPRRTSSRSRPGSGTGWTQSCRSSSSPQSKACSTRPRRTSRGVKNNDFGIRNANGLMFEVMRNLGFYIQFGETVGFVRWLRFEIDGGVGVQARIP